MYPVVIISKDQKRCARHNNMRIADCHHCKKCRCYNVTFQEAHWRYGARNDTVHFEEDLNHVDVLLYKRSSAFHGSSIAFRVAY
jgi:hypothetical protein